MLLQCEKSILHIFGGCFDAGCQGPPGAQVLMGRHQLSTQVDPEPRSEPSVHLPSIQRTERERERERGGGGDLPVLSLNHISLRLSG